MSGFPWIECFYAFCLGGVVIGALVLHFVNEPMCDRCGEETTP